VGMALAGEGERHIAREWPGANEKIPLKKLLGDGLPWVALGCQADTRVARREVFRRRQSQIAKQLFIFQSGTRLQEEGD